MRRIPFVLLGAAIFGFSSLIAGGIKSKLGVGFGVNSQKLYGDTRTGTFETGVAPLNFRYNFKPNLFFDSDLAYSQSNVAFGAGTLSMGMANIGAKLGYRLFSEKRLNPLLYVGFGALYFQTPGGSGAWDGYGAVGGGAEFFVSRHFGLNVAGDYRYTTNDGFDGLNANPGKDAFLNVQAGIIYYFGGKPGAGDFDDYADAPVEEVNLMDTDDQSSMNTATQISTVTSEEYAMMSFKKNQLLDSIRKRDRDIRLLQGKLASLGRHAVALMNKIQTGSQNSDRATGQTSQLVYYKNALVLFQAGYYDNAATSFHTLVNDNPRDPLAGSWWYWLGESYYSLGDFVGAVAAFEKAGMLNMHTAKAEMTCLMLGLSRWKAGNPGAARTDLEKLLAENPTGEFVGLTRDYLDDMRLN